MSNLETIQGVLDEYKVEKRNLDLVKIAVARLSPASSSSVVNVILADGSIEVPASVAREILVGHAQDIKAKVDSLAKLLDKLTCEINSYTQDEE